MPIIIYVYPGCRRSPQDGELTPLVDAQQHRAFRDHQQALRARTYSTIGISSQSAQRQLQSAAENNIIHALLSDPGLLLAQELKLPTFAVDETRSYQRLTLVAESGIIKRTFYPVTSAARAAAQVLAWIQIHGMRSALEQDAY